MYVCKGKPDPASVCNFHWTEIVSDLLKILKIEQGFTFMYA